MNTSKYRIKKVNETGKGAYVYLSKREREHINIRKKDDIVIDMTIPKKLVIMSIEAWGAEQVSRDFRENKD